MSRPNVLRYTSRHEGTISRGENVISCSRKMGIVAETWSWPALFIIITALIARPPPAAGEIIFDHPEQKIDPKLDDKSITVKFSFKNSGSRAVLIKKVVSSCSCTVAASDKQIYLPGECGAISATVEIGSFHGEMRKTIFIQTDDPDHPNIELSVHLNVPSLVKLSKSMVEWNEGPTYSEANVSVTIDEQLPVKLLGAKPWSSQLSASLIAVEQGKSYVLRIKPADSTKAITSAVELLTDQPNPDLRKRIWVYVRINPSPSTRASTSRPAN